MGNKLGDSLNLVTGQVGSEVTDESSVGDPPSLSEKGKADPGREEAKTRVELGMD